MFNTIQACNLLVILLHSNLTEKNLASMTVFKQRLTSLWQPAGCATCWNGLSAPFNKTN